MDGTMPLGVGLRATLMSRIGWAALASIDTTPILGVAPSLLLRNYEAPMILLLAPLAHADMALTCAFATVNATVPRNEATDVPVDVRPAVVLQGVFGPCSAAGWDVVLARADDGTVVSSASFTAEEAEDSLLELFPDGPLDANTAYALQVTPAGGLGAVTEVGFTTGEGTVAGLEGAPSLSIESASFGKRDGLLDVQWRPVAAGDPDQLSVVTLSDPDLDVSTAIVLPRSNDGIYASWPLSERPDQFCGEVVQIDGAGVAAEPVSAECVQVGGCDAAASGPSAGWLLALGLLFRRRG